MRQFLFKLNIFQNINELQLHFINNFYFETICFKN